MNIEIIGTVMPQNDFKKLCKINDESQVNSETQKLAITNLSYHDDVSVCNIYFRVSVLIMPSGLCQFF